MGAQPASLGLVGAVARVPPLAGQPPSPFPLYIVWVLGGGGYTTQIRVLGARATPWGASYPSPLSLSCSLSTPWLLEELRTEGVLHPVRGSAAGIRIQKIFFHNLSWI
jgi:hypothetical protein